MTPDRRTTIAGAALQVLASDGARGLTHRAVDTAAGLPAGSTSYYFRSRSALLEACVTGLLDQSLEDVSLLEDVLRAGDTASLARALGDVLHRWLTDHRDRHLARFELSLEAVRRPELAQALYQGGTAIRGRIASVLADLGAEDPEEQAGWLVACTDGVLFDRIAGANARGTVNRAELHRLAEHLVRGIV
ncbi:TetR/AcrR family transcriptional regulator [Nocardioides pacificus]